MAINFESIDFKQLRYFLAVAETGGYARAAQVLDITQQAVSAAIAKLENTLDTKLCERDQSGTRLTDAGLELERRARIILQDTHQAAREVWSVGKGEKGNIRIGTADDPAGSIAPRSVYMLSRKFPDVHVSISVGLNRILKDQLLDGALDLVVAAPWQPWQSDHGLIVEELYSTQLTMVCSASHPLAQKKSLSLTDLQDFPWIFPSPPAPIQPEIFREFQKQGISPPERYIYCDNVVSGISLLSYGEHLVPAHKGTIESSIKDGSLVSLPLTFDFGYRAAILAYRRGAILNEATRSLIDIIRSESRSSDE